MQTCTIATRVETWCTITPSGFQLIANSRQYFLPLFLCKCRNLPQMLLNLSICLLSFRIQILSGVFHISEAIYQSLHLAQLQLLTLLVSILHRKLLSAFELKVFPLIKYSHINLHSQLNSLTTLTWLPQATSTFHHLRMSTPLWIFPMPPTSTI